MINKYWIWFSRIPNLGSKRKMKLLEKYLMPEIIWNLNKEELLKIESIGEETANNIVNPIYKKDLEQYIEYMNKYNIDIITILDEEYPQKLRNIYDPPACIFIKGNKDVLNNIAISIIGCRQCTNYGMNIAKCIAYNLSKNNINIISGMAKGIDSYAHMGAVNAKKTTIAVLGCGLDIIYPKENLKLFNDILENNGAIISEYLIGTKPEKMNFPARNRIVSALSDGIVVIEARKRSGTLITVDFALEQGKEVYVVPGNVNSPQSVGTNELIKEGAKCITCASDIIEDLQIYL